MLELRAKTSHERLPLDTNRRDQARAMLGEIYGWSTEGFDRGSERSHSAARPTQQPDG